MREGGPSLLPLLQHLSRSRKKSRRLLFEETRLEVLSEERMEEGRTPASTQETLEVTGCLVEVQTSLDKRDLSTAKAALAKGLARFPESIPLLVRSSDNTSHSSCTIVQYKYIY